MCEARRGRACGALLHQHDLAEVAVARHGGDAITTIEKIHSAIGHHVHAVPHVTLREDRAVVREVFCLGLARQVPVESSQSNLVESVSRVGVSQSSWLVGFEMKEYVTRAATGPSSNPTP